MAESDGIARTKLLEALRAPGATVREAAKAAGFGRAHVYRLADRDADVRAALEALQAQPGKGRRVRVAAEAAPAAPVVELPAAAGDDAGGAALLPAAPAGTGALGVTAPEAGSYRRSAIETLSGIMLDESEKGLTRVAAARALVQSLPPPSALVKPPEVSTMRARVEDKDGRSAEVEGSGSGVEALIARVLGAGPNGGQR